MGVSEGTGRGEGGKRGWVEGHPHSVAWVFIVHEYEVKECICILQSLATAAEEGAEPGAVAALLD